MKCRVHILSLVCVFAVTHGVPTVAQTLSGLVLDDQNSPLAGATVSLPALHRGAVSDSLGRFIIRGIESGMYTVEFALVGYGRETRTVTIGSEPAALTVVMRPSPLQLPGVIVTGKPQPTDALRAYQPVSTLDGRDLEVLRGQSVMQSIENLPGVATYTTGAGIVKPVVRGLTSQRVVVLADHVRQEGQQWGDEHGAEMDAFDVERIEVLRGPSSVLYGSDALGGVVNIIRHEIPSADDGASQLGGTLDFNGFSNNRGAAGALSLFGARGEVGYRAFVSARNAGDISTPAGRLFNSGLRENNGGVKVGFHEHWGAATLDYTRVDQELQIHENPAEDPGATPFQNIQHDRIHAHTDLHVAPLRLEIDGSWQRNRRREFEAHDASTPVLHLELSTLAFDLKAHHHPIGTLFGTVGLSVMTQKNRSLEEEKLIPDFDAINIAGYLYEEAALGDLSASIGVRYDGRTLNVRDMPALRVTEHHLTYHALTGSAGLVWRAAEPFAFALTIGRGWRAPTAFELFVDGVHEGTVRYEVGNRFLKNESAFNIDLSARYASDRVQAELTLFRNVISNYIFISPTGTIDSTSGFPVYYHKQADATLFGGEFSVQAQVSQWLVLNAGFDYVRAENNATTKPLPLIPANRVKLGVKLTTQSLGPLRTPYVSTNARILASQNRVEEFETATAGYALVDAAVGGSIAAGDVSVNIDLIATNLFDKEYRDHLSRYKAYALNMGRNIELKLSVPFTLVR
jgi:iron complex outermembrane receptor protein